MIEIHHVSDSRLRNAYDTLYVDRPIRHLDSFYRWAYNLMKMEPGQTHLDIACGQGRIVEMAIDDHYISFGTDYSISALEVSKNSNRLFVANGEKLPIKSKSIDRLSIIGSIEHYGSPESGLQEIARLLSVDGLAYIFVPNTFSIMATVLYAWHTGKILDDGQPIQRYCTREGWEQLFEDNGLSVIDVKKYEREWPLNWGDLLYYLRRPKELLHLVLTPLVPLNLANSFMFICKKNSINEYTY